MEETRYICHSCKIKWLAFKVNLQIFFKMNSFYYWRQWLLSNLSRRHSGIFSMCFFDALFLRKSRNDVNYFGIVASFHVFRNYKRKYKYKNSRLPRLNFVVVTRPEYGEKKISWKVCWKNTSKFPSCFPVLTLVFTDKLFRKSAGLTNIFCQPVEMVSWNCFENKFFWNAERLLWIFF